MFADAISQFFFSERELKAKKLLQYLIYELSQFEFG